jgi:hypothetical protein
MGGSSKAGKPTLTGKNLALSKGHHLLPCGREDRENFVSPSIFAFIKVKTINFFLHRIKGKMSSH